jgi:hypothetical protein
MMVAKPDCGTMVDRPHDPELPEVAGYQLHICGEGEDMAIGLMFFGFDEKPLCCTHMTAEGAESYITGIIEAIRAMRERQGLREH